MTILLFFFKPQNPIVVLRSFFFFNDPATTEIYTLSLHDALPIFVLRRTDDRRHPRVEVRLVHEHGDRKSTRLNSSHMSISYAVFCLKKKKQRTITFKICNNTNKNRHI